MKPCFSLLLTRPISGCHLCDYYQKGFSPFLSFPFLSFSPFLSFPFLPFPSEPHLTLPFCILPPGIHGKKVVKILQKGITQSLGRQYVGKFENGRWKWDDKMSQQLYYSMQRLARQSPPKSQNLKLKQKSEVFSDVTHVSKRSYQFHTAPMVKHLNLDVFKVTPCNITKTHNHKHCMNYHNAKDRKRYGNFHAEMCSFVKQDQKCPEGDACLYAHSFVEEHYNYQKYKKQFCSHYPHSTRECPYADFCSYAHSEEEILAPLIHNYLEDDDFYMFYYKTEFCPFNLTEHDKSKCVYAHNWQDYRRRPSLYAYEPIPCINWKTKDYIYDYTSGCEIGSNCNMCHGWKEQQYHPSYYKTVKCDAEGCKKGSCPNYHSQKEKRIIDPDVISRAFRYVPKNRIVEGVFKTNSNKEGFKLKQDHKARTVVQPRVLNSEENDFKTKTLIAVKEKPRVSAEKPKTQWIKDKKIIDSEAESDQDENQIVAAQVGILKLDE